MGGLGGSTHRGLRFLRGSRPPTLFCSCGYPAIPPILSCSCSYSSDIRIVVYVGATGAKYPRSVTGDPFNDAVSVHLTYTPIGGEARVYTLGLRILFP